MCRGTQGPNLSRRQLNHFSGAAQSKIQPLTRDEMSGTRAWMCQSATYVSAQGSGTFEHTLRRDVWLNGCHVELSVGSMST